MTAPPTATASGTAAKPPHAAALHELGVQAARARDYQRAADLIGAALALDPRNAAAHSDRGVALKALKQGEAALACYDAAIALEPGVPEFHNNRGNVLRELGHREAALASYERAVRLRPGYAEAHHNRGVVESDLNRWQAALASFDQALALRPNYANAYCSRGVARERANRLEAALADYDAAVALEPRFTQALCNRGNVLRELQQPEAALASCERALALDPEHAQTRLNRALALLLQGDWAAGWREYEWRWRVTGGALHKDLRAFRQPQWHGSEPLAGKSVLVHAEQGLGDTLQFCRYVPLLARAGAEVVFEVQAPLLGVLADLPGVGRLLTRGSVPPATDFHCPLLSLPLAFHTEVATVPAAVPYLRSRAEQSAAWARKLGVKRRPRVGLVWSGGLRPDQPEIWALNSRRNIPLRRFTPLRRANVDFYSLQKGQPAERELADLVAAGWDGPAIIDVAGELHDFTDTAALIDNLDLVVSVDTSTAHLAGALGKPLWILNRYDTCWRWLQHRTDTPWYPNARLYRQPALGAWDSVIERVARDLEVGFP